LIAAITIRIDLEDGELSEQADISKPLIPCEEKTENRKSVTERRSNGGSIPTVLLSTFVVVLGSLEFGYCVTMKHDSLKPPPCLESHVGTRIWMVS